MLGESFGCWNYCHPHISVCFLCSFCFVVPLEMDSSRTFWCPDPVRRQGVEDGVGPEVITVS